MKGMQIHPQGVQNSGWLKRYDGTTGKTGYPVAIYKIYFLDRYLYGYFNTDLAQDNHCES
jgi:hypothetical protein